MAKTNNKNKKTKKNATNGTAWADPRNLGISDRTFFKAEDGKTRRIHLMGDPVRAHVQWIDGIGHIHSFCEFKDVKGTLVLQKDGIDVELLGKDPQLVWMVPVLVYDTDKKGQIGNRKAEDVGYEFMLWSFYANDYRRLFGIVTEWGIDEFNKKDILISGVKKGKYVNADINVAAKNALCLQSGMKDRVETEFAVYQYRDAEKWIARRITEDEFREAVDKMAEQSQGSARAAVGR